MRQAVGVKDEAVLSKELQDYCIAWLTNHIRVTDVIVIGLVER